MLLINTPFVTQIITQGRMLPSVIYNVLFNKINLIIGHLYQVKHILILFPKIPAVPV